MAEGCKRIKKCIQCCKRWENVIWKTEALVVRITMMLGFILMVYWLWVYVLPDSESVWQFVIGYAVLGWYSFVLAIVMVTTFVCTPYMFCIGWCCKEDEKVMEQYKIQEDDEIGQQIHDI